MCAGFFIYFIDTVYLLHVGLAAVDDGGWWFGASRIVEEKASGQKRRKADVSCDIPGHVVSIILKLNFYPA